MLLYGQEEGEYIFKAVTNQPTAPCIWNVTCNTWNNKAVIHELPYPDDAIFLQYPNLFTAIDFYGMGIYTVSVTAIAADGLNRNTFSKDFDITASKPTLPYPLSQKQKK